MTDHHVLIDVVAILTAVVVLVPLFQRAKLGATLGFLFAGVVIGPDALGLIEDTEAIRILGDLGVAFLLFTVGLELPLARLRVMPVSTYSLGVVQILLTGAAIALGVIAFGGSVVAAIAIGGGLALSSTAVVLRVLAERGGITSRFGRTAFTILLMQDLAVGPLLVLVVVLGAGADGIVAALGLAAVKIAAAVAVILFLGPWLIRPLFWLVAIARTPEVFAALTLLVVLCTGLAAQAAGLSMAFGAFLAGMMMADTRYRHQVAAEIQPFRGLLLGLFFITVGMAIDPRFALAEAHVVLPLALAILAGKAVIIAALALLFRASLADSVHLGVLLAQAGEFAFVLIGAGLAVGAVDSGQGQILVLAVALTMMATPPLAKAGRWLSHRIERAHVTKIDSEPETLATLTDHVFIAGFGRVGRSVARSLAARDVPYVAVDLDPHQVTQAAEDGLPVFFGDATRPEVLEAVHVERARAVVVALNTPRESLQLVALLRYIFPELKIYARAYDDTHANDLRQAGALAVVPELVATGTNLAGSILDNLGLKQTPEAEQPPDDALAPHEFRSMD